jgi:hypothetical protein
MTCERVVWRFLLNARELIHVFVDKGEICNNYAENVRRHSKRFSRPGIYVPLL